MSVGAANHYRAAGLCIDVVCIVCVWMSPGGGGREQVEEGLRIPRLTQRVHGGTQS